MTDPLRIVTHVPVAALNPDGDDDWAGRFLNHTRRKVAADTLRTVAEWGLIDRNTFDTYAVLDEAVAATRAELRRIADRIEENR